jgi:hypothetical protein
MIFEDNFEPIKFILKNKDGKEFPIQTVFLTAKQNKEVEEILTDTKIPTMTERILISCGKTFGKDKDFFAQFSLELLTQVVYYINDEKSKKNQKK